MTFALAILPRRLEPDLSRAQVTESLAESRLRLAKLLIGAHCFSNLFGVNLGRPDRAMLTDGAGPLVSSEWLAQHLNDPKLRVVDVRWRSRYENGRGISFDDYDGYKDGHIPGAVLPA